MNKTLVLAALAATFALAACSKKEEVIVPATPVIVTPAPMSTPTSDAAATSAAAAAATAANSAASSADSAVNAARNAASAATK